MQYLKIEIVNEFCAFDAREQEFRVLLMKRESYIPLLTLNRVLHCNNNSAKRALTLQV